MSFWKNKIPKPIFLLFLFALSAKVSHSLSCAGGDITTQISFDQDDKNMATIVFRGNSVYFSKSSLNSLNCRSTDPNTLQVSYQNNNGDVSTHHNKLVDQCVKSFQIYQASSKNYKFSVSTRANGLYWTGVPPEYDTTPTLWCKLTVQD